MFAKGSAKWIFISVFFTLISYAALYLTLMNPTAKNLEFSAGAIMLGFSVMIFGILTGFFIIFFQDPERTPTEGICAPADGVIKDMIREKLDGKKYYRIVTFMNVQNVHVNRIPIDGKIVSIEHKSGKYLPAYKKESIHNKQVETTLKTDIGIVKVIQITGIFARRIIVYKSDGDIVKKGERLGMIMFGSRVDLLLPAEKVVVQVQLGKKVKANRNKIARIAT
jgi:phosphatidylserine decarboxylase